MSQVERKPRYEGMSFTFCLWEDAFVSSGRNPRRSLYSSLTQRTLVSFPFFVVLVNEQ